MDQEQLHDVLKKMGESGLMTVAEGEKNETLCV